MTAEAAHAALKPTFYMRTAPIIVGVVLTVLSYILVFVVPKFEAMFKEMELGTLPTETTIVLTVGHLAATYWFVLPVLICAAVWTTAQIAKDRTRAFLLNIAVIITLGLTIGVIVMALFGPLNIIMEKIRDK